MGGWGKLSIKYSSAQLKLKLGRSLAITELDTLYIVGRNEHCDLGDYDVVSHINREIDLLTRGIVSVKAVPFLLFTVPAVLYHTLQS